MPASFFAPLFAARSQGGATYTTTKGRQPARSVARNDTAASGRGGAQPAPVSNAPSDVFQFTKTYSAGATDTVPLSDDGDFTSLRVALTVTATGNSTAGTDLLNALKQINLLASDGQIAGLTPNVDFYQLSQRFSKLHIKPTKVTDAVATAVSGSYYVSGISLPHTRGPYSIQIAIGAIADFSATTTALSVVVTISMGIGTASGRMRYVTSSLPFTPSASGTQDLGPLAPIQDEDLTELFISGLTSNTADINYLQLTGASGTMAPRVLASSLVNAANAEMVTALDADKLFPCFALKSNIKLGRKYHGYITWGASPSVVIVIGQYWFD